MKSIIDKNFQPDQFLVLILRNDQAHFIGVETTEEMNTLLKKSNPIDAKQPKTAVLVEYMLAAASGNTRHETMGSAIKCKLKGVDGLIQPAPMPHNLHSILAQAWWEAPRDNQFPDYNQS